MIARIAQLLVMVIVFILGCPLLAIGVIFNIKNVPDILADYKMCRAKIYGNQLFVPPFFLHVLRVSEDRRNNWHCGIDPISILRALVKTMLCGPGGGASTIEQQLVRTLTARYERSLFRKLREQLIAVALTITMPRYLLASKYLSVAYFGTGKLGISYFESLYGCSLSEMSVRQVIGVLARLKYPEPAHPSDMWRSRYSRRCLYIENRLRGHEVKAFLLQALETANVAPGGTAIKGTQ